MTEQLNQTTEDALGSEFWTQPTDVLQEEFNLIYASVLSVLREEVRTRGGSAIDFLIVERMAFSYAYLRMREALVENSMTDRTRREMNKDWLDLATAMKKMWNTEDRDDAQEVVKKKAEKAIYAAVKDLPEAEGRKILALLGESMASVGL